MSELDSLTGQAVFETERLSVRRWRRTEADGVFRIYSDPAGARWVDDGQPITMAESEAWLGVTATNYARRGYGMFAVDDRASGELLGYCGLVHPGGQVEAEVKYAFARSVWGRGFASEVVHGMVRHASEAHGIEVIIATVAPENVASQRVLLKNGFTYLEERAEEDDGICWCYQRG